MDHTEVWLWARQNRMTIGYEPNQTEGQSGTGQTIETEAFVWVRPNIPNSFIDQTEQTDNGLWTKPNRLNFC